MDAVIQTEGLGKRYKEKWALADCSLRVPTGTMAGLVGPNGAGKTTLLSMITGMLPPTAGRIQVAGGAPAAGPGQLAKVGFVAQDAPVYAGMSIADHFKLGAHLNPRWDMDLARERVAHLGLDQKQEAGKLSGGQRAQLALTMALAKSGEPFAKVVAGTERQPGRPQLPQGDIHRRVPRPRTRPRTQRLRNRDTRVVHLPVQPAHPQLRRPLRSGERGHAGLRGSLGRAHRRA